MKCLKSDDCFVVILEEVCICLCMQCLLPPSGCVFSFLIILCSVFVLASSCFINKPNAPLEICLMSITCSFFDNCCVINEMLTQPDQIVIHRPWKRVQPSVTWG